MCDCDWQLFSGSVLTRVEQQLNITSQNDTVVDVGLLFQNGRDGEPVVNLTDIVEALPEVPLSLPHIMLFMNSHSQSRRRSFEFVLECQGNLWICTQFCIALLMEYRFCD